MLIPTVAHLATEFVLALVAGRSESWHVEISVDRRCEPKPAEIAPDVMASVTRISDRLAEGGH